MHQKELSALQVSLWMVIKPWLASGGIPTPCVQAFGHFAELCVQQAIMTPGAPEAKLEWNTCCFCVLSSTVALVLVLMDSIGSSPAIC